MPRPTDETTAGLQEPDTDDSRAGQLLAGKYEIRDEIAAGAMGGVYKARERGLGRWVAVKLVREDLVTDDEIVKRFYKEMQATARIEHPNTVRIYDFGHADDGGLFLVMELLEGRTLAEALEADGPMPVARAARIGAQIAGALAAAHREGVVHRDLKPDNILLTSEYGPQEWVKVLDFGLARLVDAYPSDRTEGGQRVGTPVYMAPEIGQRQNASPRSDLYALGVLLFEMITGEPPFDGQPYEVIAKHISEEAPAASSRVLCPEWMDRLIASLLRKDPARRPRDAGRIAGILERGAIREAAVASGHLEPAAPPPRTPTWVWGLLSIGAALLGLLVGSVAAGALVALVVLLLL